MTLESMKEKCKNLQYLLDNSTKESSDKDSHRRDLENQRNVMAFDMANMEEEMKVLRKQTSDKFELERRYHELQRKYEEYKEEISVRKE